eukprot:Gb_34757 [translate_table: standard]
MASTADTVNQICEKVEALEINPRPSSVGQEKKSSLEAKQAVKCKDGRTELNHSSPSREDKETTTRGLPSASQNVAGIAGISVAFASYIAPNSHPATQVYSYGGNDAFALDSDGYPPSAFVNDFHYHFPGYPNEIAPLFYPPVDGGYSPQTLYSSTGTLIPAFGTDNIFYGHHFQLPGSVYQQAASPECQLWSFPMGLPPGEVVMPGSEDLGIQGSYFHSFQGGSNPFFGGRPGFQPYLMTPNGSYGSGILPAALTGTTPVNAAIGYDSMRPAIAHWMDPRNVGEHQKFSVSSGVHAAVGESVPSVGLRPLQPQQLVYSPHVTAGLHPLSVDSFEIPLPGTQWRMNDGLISYPMQTGGNNSGLVVDNKRLMGSRALLDNGQGSLGSSNDSVHHQTVRSVNHQMTSSSRQANGEVAFPDRVNEILSVLGDGDSYNRPDFVTNYDDAKFFVIKSYSEDDIHKSIKYNVWASTPNGNLKLNQAYQDAQRRAGDNPGGCPIFFFFSVNGSGRFCGIAEMVGPVDFSKSMDFWQQDKWAGSFSVRWHIIKDIPNSQLRHIILESNDNKPVTNSRDTQEINIQEGLEMLNIFKNYPARSSIVDDFYLYESRQRALQEKRARQNAQLHAHQVANLSMEHFPDGLHNKQN